jgi:hypothetical protein
MQSVRVEMYYTYAYLREDGTPYYIGKGSGRRIYSTNRKFKPPKDKSRIIFLKQNLTEEEAFKHEIYMIAVFGRKDLGTGILRNQTDGGDGVSGLIRDEETKKKISDGISGKNHPMYGKVGKLHHGYGIPCSDETKQKISNTLKGRPLPKDVCEKIQKIMEERYSHIYYQITKPDGSIEYIHNSLKAYSIENSLKPGQMYNVANGKANHHKGYKVKKYLKTLQDLTET